MNNRTYFEDAKALWIVVFIIFCGCVFQSNAQQTLQKLNLPEGFAIEIYAADVPKARQLALGETGIVYAGNRGAGKVYAITDNNGDDIYTIAEDLRLPSGVAYRNGSLYMGAVSQILRFDDIDNNLQNPPEPVLLTDEFSTDGHHGGKLIDCRPPSYQNKILIAEHGSWNRSEKIGYRITEVTLKNEQTTSYEPFIDGWLQENDAVWGRPVDFLQLSTAQYSSQTIKAAPFITLLTTKTK